MYRQKLLATVAMHLLFHVSQLRLAIGDCTLSAILTEDMEINLKPAAILERRKELDRQDKVPKNVDRATMKLASHLGDKVDFEVARNDRHVLFYHALLGFE